MKEVLVRFERHPNAAEGHGWYIPIPPEFVDSLEWDQTFGTVLVMKTKKSALVVEKYNEPEEK